MVDGNTGNPNRQSQGKDSHHYHVDGRFTSYGLAAHECKVGDEEDDIADNIHDETFVAWCTTMYDARIIFKCLSAIEVLDLWCKDENGDETDGYEKLTK